MTFAPATAVASSVKCELAGELLRSSGRIRMRVSGRSMVPIIWPGDTLIISGVDDDGEFLPGEIVFFRRGDRMVAHRLIAKNESEGSKKLRTQGDALADADAPVSRGDLLGRVELILRKGRQFRPARHLQGHEQAITRLVRKSDIAARVIVRMHWLYHSLQDSTR